MKYDFDETINRKGTYSSKWDSRQRLIDIGLTERYDDDTIPLFVADMDFACPVQIVKALHSIAEHRVYGYSIIPPEYFKSITGWFKRRYGWKIKPEEIVYNSGTVDALNVAVSAFTEKGDGIIVQQPVYPPFTNATLNAGRRLLNNVLINCGGYYTINFEDFENKAKQKETKLFFLCNPHNPTGRIFNPDELNRLSEICRVNDVLIVSDEIHGDIIRCDQTFYPIACVVKDTDHIITCTGINKSFNTAGLHCSNIIIPNETLRKKYLLHRRDQTPTPFAVAALIAAYNECEEWLEELKKYLDDTLEFIDGFLKTKMPKVKMRLPEGTYVVWLDFSGYGIPSAEIHKRIYNDANVLLQNGERFGSTGECFQRMCIPSPREVIKEAFYRIESAFSDLN